MKLLWLSIPLMMLVACGDETTSSKSNDDEVSSSSALSYGELTDARDEKKYKTIVIGTQTWMAENLAYLPLVNAPTDTSQVEARYYVYDYAGMNVKTAKALANYSTHGVLYNWVAANNACPVEWHLPSDEEWTILETFVDSTGAHIGTKLKAKILWGAKGIPGSDDLGFSAIPSGYQFKLGFGYLGLVAYWWLATVPHDSFADDRGVVADGSDVLHQIAERSFGHSVRCLKDSN